MAKNFISPRRFWKKGKKRLNISFLSCVDIIQNVRIKLYPWIFSWIPLHLFRNNSQTKKWIYCPDSISLGEPRSPRSLTSHLILSQFSRNRLISSSPYITSSPKLGKIGIHDTYTFEIKIVINNQYLKSIIKQNFYLQSGIYFLIKIIKLSKE